MKDHVAQWNALSCNINHQYVLSRSHPDKTIRRLKWQKHKLKKKKKIKLNGPSCLILLAKIISHQVADVYCVHSEVDFLIESQGLYFPGWHFLSEWMQIQQITLDRQYQTTKQCRATVLAVHSFETSASQHVYMSVTLHCLWNFLESQGLGKGMLNMATRKAPISIW